MNFKAFVCFDDDGEVKDICLEKKCDLDCSEYIIKLIPIKRNLKVPEIKLKDFEKVLDKSVKQTEDLTSSLKKSIEALKRIKIK